MTNNFDPNQLRGQPKNKGSWVANENGDPEATLGTSGVSAVNWGQTGITKKSRTPWGAPQDITENAPGITTVGTPGHGGTKLSKERNRLIPASLRQSSGWYEEDCEAAIVGMYFPEAYPHWTQEKFEGTVKNWFPDKYEAATGNTLVPGESLKRDESLWNEAHATDFVSTSAEYDKEHSGMTRVTARRGADGATGIFLVNSDEYSEARKVADRGASGRFVIDPSQHEQQASPPEPVKTLAPKFHGVGKGKTAAGQQLIDRDLNQRWRSGDSVRTLAEIIATDGLSGKGAWMDGGKRKYVLSQKANVEESVQASYAVSKATWDAVEAPDERKPSRIISQDRELAQNRIAKLPFRQKLENRQKHAAEMKKIDDAYNAAVALES